jgi:hypothetical protein
LPKAIGDAKVISSEQDTLFISVDPAGTEQKKKNGK